MKILSCKNKIIKKEKFLYEALEIDTNRKNVISFVGGGGKTTSIYTLAKELSTLGKKVIVTTTTHMHMPDDCVVFKGDIEDIKSALKGTSLITVGTKGDNNKISSVGKEVASSFIDFCDILLIEADGSRMLPLKAPAHYEPVILKDSTMVIGVSGIDGVFKSIKESCHRPEIVTEVLNKNLSDEITTKDVAKLLSSEYGQRKDVQNCLKAEYRAIINKVDNEELLILAKEIAEDLNSSGIKTIITKYI